MSDKPSHPSFSEFGEDSDLRQVVAAVWDTRRLVAVSVLVVSSLFWLWMIAVGLRAGMNCTWRSEIELVFDGVASNQYPNGTPFSLSDLTLPTILNRVYEINSLREYGITRSDFIEAIAISNAAPTDQFVRARYAMLLRNERTPVTQIREIEREYAEEMEAAARGHAVLTLKLRSRPWPWRPVLPSAIGNKVLLDIPRVWARYMTEETAALALELDLHTARSLESSNLGQLDPLIAYDAIQGTLELLDRNLDRLATVPQAVTTRDPESNRSIKDLRSRIGELRGFVVDDILGPTITAAGSPDPRMIAEFFQSRIDDIRQRQLTLTRQAERIERVVVEYAESSPRQTAADSIGTIEDLRGLAGGTTIPQFGSDFLDRLVRVGTESTALSFRQDLSRQRLERLLRAANLNLEIQRLEEIIELITAATAGEAATSPVSPDPSEPLPMRLDALLRELAELFDATDRIGSRILEMGSGGVVAPYRTVMLRNDPQISALVIQPRTMRLFGIVVAATGFLTMLGGLLHRMVASAPGRATAA
jgi:hypothetical protein